jgi:phenylalanyl-tRNA synthetase beta chain
LEKNSVSHLNQSTSIANDQFEDLCFEFGLEVEWGTAESMKIANRTDESGATIDISKQDAYKLEVAANRYDLLCLEGISQSLRSYLGLSKIPRLSIKNQRVGGLERMIIKKETQSVRPFVVCAILRNIQFD